MADNITLNAGSGGAVLRTDDDGVAQWQYVKLAFGADNTQTIVSAANPIPVDASGNAVPVTDNGGTLSIDDGAGSITVDGTVTASNAAGDVAHDSADSGNPIKIGVKAVNAEPGAVAANDRVNLIADLVGKLITLPYANPEQFVRGTANSVGTSNTQIIAAPGAGVKLYVTSIVVANTSATDTDVAIKDGTTEVMRVPAPANGGATINLAVPLVLTANTALQFASSASVTTMYVTAIGYKGA